MSSILCSHTFSCVVNSTFLIGFFLCSLNLKSIHMVQWYWTLFLTGYDDKKAGLTAASSGLVVEWWSFAKVILSQLMSYLKYLKLLAYFIYQKKNKLLAYFWMCRLKHLSSLSFASWHLLSLSLHFALWPVFSLF